MSKQFHNSLCNLTWSLQPEIPQYVYSISLEELGWSYHNLLQSGIQTHPEYYCTDTEEKQPDGEESQETGRQDDTGDENKKGKLKPWQEEERMKGREGCC